LTYIEELETRVNEQQRVIAALVLTAGGTVEVTDAVLLNIDDRDWISVVQNPLNGSHIVSVKRHGAPDS
jgi:hypothetical protein